MPSLECDESYDDDANTPTEADEVTNDEDPAFNAMVKENSEHSTYTTAVMSNITTVTNSSIVSSTVPTYSSGMPSRVYESICNGRFTEFSHPRTVMSTGASSNLNGKTES